MLDIAVGHQLDIFTHILGDFSSVSALATIAYPEVSFLDDHGKPTGKTAKATAFDQIAISGVLKSGAMISFIQRGGYSSTKGRKQLIWIIDGENGSITIENDQGTVLFVLKLIKQGYTGHSSSVFNIP